MDIDLVLESAARLGASDIHLKAGEPPIVRVKGKLVRLEDEFEELDSEILHDLIFGMLSDAHQGYFEEHLELDLSYQLPGKVGDPDDPLAGARFRVNIYQQMGKIGAAFRTIPAQVMPLERLNLPPALTFFTTLPSGLVLITGPTGSGKSTTLAAMIDKINRTRAEHIMSVEDPVEFVHHDEQSVINQREVGHDTHGFSAALKHVLRQDPDVILVGEMRDLETIALALTAAETGHLVFSTLHTQDAPQTMDRIIDVFPAEQQGQIRAQLANAFQGVVTQKLVPTADSSGRAAACEVLLPTPAVRNQVREGKIYQIENTMVTSAQQGMQTMSMALARLVADGTIAREEAVRHIKEGDNFDELVAKATAGELGGGGFSSSAPGENGSREEVPRVERRRGEERGARRQSPFGGRRYDSDDEL